MFNFWSAVKLLKGVAVVGRGHGPDCRQSQRLKSRWGCRRAVADDIRRSHCFNDLSHVVVVEPPEPVLGDRTLQGQELGTLQSEACFVAAGQEPLQASAGWDGLYRQTGKNLDIEQFSS